MEFPTLHAVQEELRQIMSEATTPEPGVYDLDKVKSITGTKAEKLPRSKP